MNQQVKLLCIRPREIRLTLITLSPARSSHVDRKKSESLKVSDAVFGETRRLHVALYVMRNVDDPSRLALPEIMMGTAVIHKAGAPPLAMSETLLIAF